MAMKQQQQSTVPFTVTGDLPEMPSVVDAQAQDALNKWWTQVRVTLEDRNTQIADRIAKIEAKL